MRLADLGGCSSWALWHRIMYRFIGTILENSLLSLVPDLRQLHSVASGIFSFLEDSSLTRTWLCSHILAKLGLSQISIFPSYRHPAAPTFCVSNDSKHLVTSEWVSVTRRNRLSVLTLTRYAVFCGRTCWACLISRLCGNGCADMLGNVGHEHHSWDSHRKLQTDHFKTKWTFLHCQIPLNISTVSLQPTIFPLPRETRGSVMGVSSWKGVHLLCC